MRWSLALLCALAWTAEAGTTSQPQTQVTTQAPQQRPNQSECAALDARIAKLDAMARQPQTGQMQDWISAQKREARSRQMSLRC